VKYLSMLKSYWGLLMDWLATPIVWLFWSIRKRWLGRNIANIISLARLPLMVWILTKLVDADPQQTIRLIFCVGVVQILDGLDGAVARGLGTDGPWGGAIDGGVDKINTLMFIGLLIWQMLREPETHVAAIICMLLLFNVAVLQVVTILVNSERQYYTDELGSDFDSRLPAQINFVASMLIIAGCWVISDIDTSSLVLATGCIVMVGLSVWSLRDYSDDLRQLKQKYANA
jgi:phosphatidylglycerophosphate synthase